MKTLALVLIPVSLLACAADEAPGVLDPGQFDEANPALGRGVAEFDATLNVSSSSTSDLITYLSGWTCNTTGGLRYSEVERDHEGQAQRISHEQSHGMGFFGTANVHMPFTQNLDHSSPIVSTTVTHRCSRNIEVTCPPDSKSDVCYDTESFSIDWNCEIRDLPTSPGASVTQRCESRSSFWGFLNQFSWAPVLRDLDIRSTVTFKSARTQFDYNNCNASNGKPFYLRLSQGVGGQWFEDDFILFLEIDGEPVLQTPSLSGLYSIAVAYCPADDKEEIKINLSAIEDDLWWDDEYAAAPGSANIPVGRGEVRQVTLNRDGLFGTFSSNVLVEVFGDE